VTVLPTTVLLSRPPWTPAATLAEASPTYRRGATSALICNTGNYALIVQGAQNTVVSNNPCLAAPGASGANTAAAIINGSTTNGLSLASTLIEGNQFTGGLQFLSGPATSLPVVRGNPGYNPVGAPSTPAVPASGTALAGNPNDATFYVTAGASSVTMAIENGPTITVPAGACVPIRVPATKTLTPTYTTAPTWVVEYE